MSKRVVCLLLAVMLCVGLLPFGALADGADVTVSGGIVLANGNTSLTIYAQPVDIACGAAVF